MRARVQQTLEMPECTPKDHSKQEKKQTKTVLLSTKRTMNKAKVQNGIFKWIFSPKKRRGIAAAEGTE